jgi:SAM-dependent methyltransferase
MPILENCPVCKALTISSWQAARDRHYGNAGSWALASCGACDAKFLNPMPTEPELGAFYPAEYYSFQGNETAPKDSLTSNLRKALLPAGTKDPKRVPGRVLDIGCGSAWKLREFEKLGWEVMGVEYSEGACEVARSHGVPVFHGSLLEAKLESSSFDYIRSNHSFEHMVNPHELLEEIARLLKPGGQFLVAVPDAHGLMAKLFGDNWYFLGAPVHTITYNRKNLVSMLSSHGFEIESARGNSDHGGTLGSLQMWLLRNSTKRFDEGRLHRNKSLILVGFWFSKLLDRLGQGDCVEVVASRP